jgi:hypothetical protein
MMMVVLMMDDWHFAAWFFLFSVGDTSTIANWLFWFSRAAC